MILTGLAPILWYWTKFHLVFIVLIRVVPNVWIIVEQWLTRDDRSCLFLQCHPKCKTNANWKLDSLGKGEHQAGQFPTRNSELSDHEYGPKQNCKKWNDVLLLQLKNDC